MRGRTGDHLPPMPPDREGFAAFHAEWSGLARSLVRRAAARWSLHGDEHFVETLTGDVLCEAAARPFGPSVPYRLARLAGLRTINAALRERRWLPRRAPLPEPERGEADGSLLVEHDGFALVDWLDATRRDAPGKLVRLGLMPRPPRTCVWCGASIEHRPYRVKSCGQRCAGHARMVVITDRVRPLKRCEHCREYFYPARSERRFCGRRCAGLHGAARLDAG